ncbi:hypothetical protein DIPPA_08097 [Diplonema papillatum]|nr:hypothetical protein DIPPA_08097 [Diplonema papillatum]
MKAGGGCFTASADDPAEAPSEVFRRRSGGGSDAENLQDDRRAAASAEAVERAAVRRRQEELRVLAERGRALHGVKAALLEAKERRLRHRGSAASETGLPAPPVKCARPVSPPAPDRPAAAAGCRQPPAALERDGGPPPTPSFPASRSPAAGGVETGLPAPVVKCARPVVPPGRSVQPAAALEHDCGPPPTPSFPAPRSPAASGGEPGLPPPPAAICSRAVFPPAAPDRPAPAPVRRQHDGGPPPTPSFPAPRSPVAGAGEAGAPVRLSPQYVGDCNAPVFSQRGPPLEAGVSLARLPPADEPRLFENQFGQCFVDDRETRRVLETSRVPVFESRQHRAADGPSRQPVVDRRESETQQESVPGLNHSSRSDFAGRPAVDREHRARVPEFESHQHCVAGVPSRRPPVDRRESEAQQESVPGLNSSSRSDFAGRPAVDRGHHAPPPGRKPDLETRLPQLPRQCAPGLPGGRPERASYPIIDGNPFAPPERSREYQSHAPLAAGFQSGQPDTVKTRPPPVGEGRVVEPWGVESELSPEGDAGVGSRIPDRPPPCALDEQPGLVPRKYHPITDRERGAPSGPRPGFGNQRPPNAEEIWSGGGGVARGVVEVEQAPGIAQEVGDRPLHRQKDAQCKSRTGHSRPEETWVGEQTADICERPLHREDRYSKLCCEQAERRKTRTGPSGLPEESWVGDQPPDTDGAALHRGDIREPVLYCAQAARSQTRTGPPQRPAESWVGDETPDICDRPLHREDRYSKPYSEPAERSKTRTVPPRRLEETWVGDETADIDREVAAQPLHRDPDLYCARSPTQTGLSQRPAAAWTRVPSAKTSAKVQMDPAPAPPPLGREAVRRSTSRPGISSAQTAKVQRDPALVPPEPPGRAAVGRSHPPLGAAAGAGADSAQEPAPGRARGARRRAADAAAKRAARLAREEKRRVDSAAMRALLSRPPARQHPPSGPRDPATPPGLLAADSAAGGRLSPPPPPLGGGGRGSGHGVPERAPAGPFGGELLLFQGTPDGVPVRCDPFAAERPERQLPTTPDEVPSHRKHFADERLERQFQTTSDEVPIHRKHFADERLERQFQTTPDEEPVHCSSFVARRPERQLQTTPDEVPIHRKSFAAERQFQINPDVVPIHRNSFAAEPPERQLQSTPEEAPIHCNSSAAPERPRQTTSEGTPPSGSRRSEQQQEFAYAWPEAVSTGQWRHAANPHDRPGPHPSTCLAQDRVAMLPSSSSSSANHRAERYQEFAHPRPDAVAANHPQDRPVLHPSTCLAEDRVAPLPSSSSGGADHRETPTRPRREGPPGSHRGRLPCDSRAHDPQSRDAAFFRASSADTVRTTGTAPPPRDAKLSADPGAVQTVGYGRIVGCGDVFCDETRLVTAALQGQVGFAQAVRREKPAAAASRQTVVMLSRDIGITSLSADRRN